MGKIRFEREGGSVGIKMLQDEGIHYPKRAGRKKRHPGYCGMRLPGSTCVQRTGDFVILVKRAIANVLTLV